MRIRYFTRIFRFLSYRAFDNEIQRNFFLYTRIQGFLLVLPIHFETPTNNILFVLNNLEHDNVEAKPTGSVDYTPLPVSSTRPVGHRPSVPPG